MRYRGLGEALYGNNGSLLGDSSPEQEKKIERRLKAQKEIRAQSTELARLLNRLQASQVVLSNGAIESCLTDLTQQQTDETAFSAPSQFVRILAEAKSKGLHAFLSSRENRELVDSILSCVDLLQDLHNAYVQENPAARMFDETIEIYEKALQALRHSLDQVPLEASKS
jgi:hypothetical protein